MSPMRQERGSRFEDGTREFNQVKSAKLKVFDELETYVLDGPFFSFLF
jgi:hypothetical protein